MSGQSETLKVVGQTGEEETEDGGQWTRARAGLGHGQWDLSGARSR